MPKHDSDKLPAIDAADLSKITGGTHRPGHVTSSSNAQITAALTSITDSLKNLSNQNTGSSASQLLPFLLLAKGGGCPGGNCGR